MQSHFVNLILWTINSDEQWCFVTFDLSLTFTWTIQIGPRALDAALYATKGRPIYEPMPVMTCVVS